jgi:hypothetical protein
MTSIIFINKLKSNGCNPKKVLRIKDASKLMQYAPINATIAIFHLGGGTIAFNPGRVNHVSKPVAFCRYGVEYLFTSSVCLCKSSEFSHASCFRAQPSYCALRKYRTKCDDGLEPL